MVAGSNPARGASKINHLAGLFGGCLGAVFRLAHSLHTIRGTNSPFRCGVGSRRRRGSLAGRFLDRTGLSHGRGSLVAVVKEPAAFRGFSTRGARAVLEVARIRVAPRCHRRGGADGVTPHTSPHGDQPQSLIQGGAIFRRACFETKPLLEIPDEEHYRSVHCGWRPLDCGRRTKQRSLYRRGQEGG